MAVDDGDGTVNDTQPRALGWWSISGEALLDLMRRAHAGEDPETLYMEEYANSEHDYGPGEDE